MKEKDWECESQEMTRVRRKKKNEHGGEVGWDERERGGDKQESRSKR